MFCSAFSSSVALSEFSCYNKFTTKRTEDFPMAEALMEKDIEIDDASDGMARFKKDGQ